MNRTVLYRDGNVRPITGNPSEAASPVLVTRGGRVVATGSDADMRAIARSGADIVNLVGATLLPGFVDTHPHLFHFSARDSAASDARRM